jgi:hypothetical protein
LRIKVTRGNGKPLDATRALARVALLGAPALFASAMALIGEQFTYLPDDHAFVLAAVGISVALAGTVWTSFFLDEHDRGLPDTLTDTHVIPEVAPEEDHEIFPAQKPTIALGLGVTAGVLSIAALVLLMRAGGPPAEVRAALAVKAPLLAEALRMSTGGRRVRMQLNRTEDGTWTLTAVVPVDSETLRSDEKLGPQAESILEIVKHEAETIPGLDAAGVRFHTGGPFAAEREFARDLHEEERVPASDGE